jgi:hypothetical protein
LQGALQNQAYAALADSLRSGINRRCYNENPILCSCSAHEYGRALARPVTVRSVGAVPSTIAAMTRGDRKGKRDEQADVPFSLDLTLGDPGEGATAAEPDFRARPDHTDRKGKDQTTDNC